MLKVRILFIGVIVIIAAVVLWRYINTYVYKPRASGGPMYSIDLSQTTGSLSLNQETTITIILSVTSPSINRITGFSLDIETDRTKGQILDVTAPTGTLQDGSSIPFQLISNPVRGPSLWRISYILNERTTARLPMRATMQARVKAIGIGRMPFTITNAQVIGNIDQYAYERGSVDTIYFDVVTSPSVTPPTGTPPPTNTATPTPTRTPTPVPPTFTPTPTRTPTPASTNTPTPTRTPTSSPTQVPTAAVTSLPTPTPTVTPTPVPSSTPSLTATTTTSPLTNTPGPTLIASNTPPPTNTLTPTTIACPRKQQGDADCNGTINVIDFEIWRGEFLGALSTKRADFNGNGVVNLNDFETWRANFQ